jgi:hypothetical protein
LGRPCEFCEVWEACGLCVARGVWCGTEAGLSARFMGTRLGLVFRWACRDR